jgi:general secretion pathway protein I
MTRPTTRPTRRAGFTLVEVMLALAVLGLGLTLLIKSLASNVANAGEAQMMGVVAELARGKMYDVEELLRKDGFQETDQSSNGDFSEEGWPGLTWESKVEIPEIPTLAALQAMQQGQDGAGAGSGSGSGAGSAAAGTSSDPMAAFESTGLGGMLTMFGGFGDMGGGGEGAGDQMGAAFIQQYFDMVQQVFKASIRKVTLTVHYQNAGEKRDFSMSAYFTDDSAMEKVIGNLGAEGLRVGEPDPSTSGGGGGAGTGGGSGSTGGGRMGSGRGGMGGGGK